MSASHRRLPLCLAAVAIVIGCGESSGSAPDGADDVSDGAIVGAPADAAVVDPAPDGEMPAESLLPDRCMLTFPPAAGIACSIEDRGPAFYVGPSGSDTNDGTSAAQAWATLDYAVRNAPAGSTVKVAQGTYATESITVDRALTVKGGYDAAFASWDPDAHPTVFTGRLTLADAGAVWGGFQMLAMGMAEAEGQYHTLRSGALVRNYVHIDYAAGRTTDFIAIDATVDAETRMDDRPEIRCNDIYVKVTFTQPLLGTADAIRFGPIGGVVDSNRICLEQNGTAWGDVFWGYGGPSSVILTNNVFEDANRHGYAIEIYGNGVEKLVIVTNNTLVTHHGPNIWGYDTGVHWRLTNNIVVTNDRGGAIFVGAGDLAIIESSENNLTFGSGNNSIRPLAERQADNLIGADVTLDQVFVDALGGDLHLADGSPAVGTGLNVDGQVDYGSVTRDLGQSARGAPPKLWDRGAYGFASTR